MKKRRTFLSLFMLASLAFVGVGYAALTNTLSIGGGITATKNDDNLKVEFVASKAHTRDAQGNEDTSYTASHSVSGKTAEISVGGINEVGSYAEFIFVVKNNSPVLDGQELDAVLDAAFDIKVNTSSVENAPEKTGASPTDNVFEGDHFTISVNYTDDSDDFGTTYTADLTTIDELNPGEVELAVGKVVYVVVKVELTTPININDDTPFEQHNITITFNAETPNE